MKKLFAVLLILAACSSPKKDAQVFLDSYNAEYVKLLAVANSTAWVTNTQIREGDTLNAHNSQVDEEALAAFTGSVANITTARELLNKKSELDSLQIRQLESVLYHAAADPQIVAPLVKERIAATLAQVEKLFGYTYRLNGKAVTTNEIDRMLVTETNPTKRLDTWEASKEVGRDLKSGLVNLRRLRNSTVQALEYADYFSYQVSEYGMTADEMMQFMARLNNELRPLYRELHTYARYELAKKYKVKEVPDYLPAHWLPDRWAQNWGSLIEVEGLDVDSALKSKSPEWIVREGEALYTSIGFSPLPESFWTKSSLYPYPADSAVKKNNHASAWHMDLNEDVRSLMSVESNSTWFETSNHELGHIYYSLTYTNKDVPPILRDGANRAFHEGIGSMMGMAAMQKPYLIGRGLISQSAKTDSIQTLLKEALNYAVFIPFAAGTMSEFEKALYSDNLSEGEFNKKWWELVKKYQGVVPPSERGEGYCDACTKTHITDDPAQYYDYALSYIIMFQLHQHISENILHQNPHATNYFGNKDIGNFLKKIMYPGNSRDWRLVIKEATNDDMNAKAMLRYFDPLISWLKEQNEGRKYTLAETVD